MKPFITADAVRELNQFNVSLLLTQMTRYQREAKAAPTAAKRCEAKGAAEAMRKAAALLNLENVQLEQQYADSIATGVKIITRLPTPKPQGVAA